MEGPETILRASSLLLIGFALAFLPLFGMVQVGLILPSVVVAVGALLVMQFVPKPRGEVVDNVRAGICVGAVCVLSFDVMQLVLRWLETSARMPAAL